MNSKLVQDPLNSLWHILETEKSVELERNQEEGRVKINSPNNKILVEGLSGSNLNWSLNNSSPPTSTDGLLKHKLFPPPPSLLISLGPSRSGPIIWISSKVSANHWCYTVL